ncbi:MAG: SGNH/GDSL hydrolase family protein [Planctomycetes bacterium]|nr:SGNH/GDSL hydrolase family protein [Planctomycetota bacterium]
MTGSTPAAAAAARRTRPLTRIGLAAATLVVCLLAAELVARVSGLARNVGPTFTEWDAEDGVRLRRGYSCVRRTPEFTMRFTTNSAGYRGAELPARIERSVLFLGDSFTMGYGVDDGSEFVARLAERAGPGLTLVNAGLGGTGNGRWIHVLERDAPALSPAVVVLQVCENDFEDNLSDGLYVLDARGELVTTPPPERGVLRRLSRIIEWVPGLAESHLVALGRGLRSGPPPEHAAQAVDHSRPPAAELTRRLIERALEVCAERSWPVLGLVCAGDASRREFFVEVFRARGTPLLVAPTKGERPELYYRVDGHWNERGHAEMAELVWRAVSSPPFAGALSRSDR